MKKRLATIATASAVALAGMTGTTAQAQEVFDLSNALPKGSAELATNALVTVAAFWWVGSCALSHQEGNPLRGNSLDICQPSQPKG